MPTKHKTGRLMAAVAAIGILLAAMLPADAMAKYASLVIDAETGEVLHSVNADTRNYPASLTKMMTLYLMFEAIDEGRLGLDERIVFSSRAARQPSSKMYIPAGDSVSVREAILALAIKSANDVASAVAEHMGGTERKFALMMTAKARELGMNRTTFRNASGLPHRAQMSTARDLSRLAVALYRDFPHHYGYFSETSFRFDGTTHKSHNSLLTTYEGTDGIKTGYIRASGFQLVTSVQRGDTRLIGVVLGGKSPRERNNHMTTLLNNGFAKLDSRLAGNSNGSDTWTAEVIPAPGKKPAAKASPVTSRAPDVSVAKVKRDGRETWGVQVGAYRYREPAIAIAEKAISIAPTYLSEGEVMVAPLRKKNGRVLYRARVVGVDKSIAAKACGLLARKNMDCLEVKVKMPLEVASAN